MMVTCGLRPIFIACMKIDNLLFMKHLRFCMEIECIGGGHIAVLYDIIIVLVQASLKLCMTLYCLVDANLQFWLQI